MQQLLSRGTYRDDTMEYVGRLLAQYPEQAPAAARKYVTKSAI